jgi:hypothetical protein
MMPAVSLSETRDVFLRARRWVQRKYVAPEALNQTEIESRVFAYAGAPADGVFI